MSSVNEWEKEQSQEVILSLREQLRVEGQLIALYEEYERQTENKATKRIMQVFKLDSQRHIHII